MNINEYIEKTDVNIFYKGSNKEIENAYAGDFLSFVMGNAKENSIWFTVMNNVNVAGVATLIDCTCIVLCENIKPDKILLEKCISNNINLFGTKKSVYEACIEYGRL